MINYIKWLIVCIILEEATVLNAGSSVRMFSRNSDYIASARDTKIRKHAYKKDFSILDQIRIRDAIFKLGIAIKRMERILSQRDSDTCDTKEIIQPIFESMKSHYAPLSEYIEKEPRLGGETYSEEDDDTRYTTDFKVSTITTDFDVLTTTDKVPIIDKTEISEQMKVSSHKPFEGLNETAPTSYITEIASTEFTESLTGNEGEVFTQNKTESLEETLFTLTDIEGLVNISDGLDNVTRETISFEVESSSPQSVNITQDIVTEYTGDSFEEKTEMSLQEISESSSEGSISPTGSKALLNDSHEIELMTPETLFSKFDDSSTEMTSMPLVTKYTELFIENGTEFSLQETKKGFNESVFDLRESLEFLSDLDEDKQLSDERILPEVDSSSNAPTTSQENITGTEETFKDDFMEVSFQETNKLLNKTGEEILLKDLSVTEPMTNETSSFDVDNFSIIQTSTPSVTIYSETPIRNETEMPSQETYEVLNEILFIPTSSDSTLNDSYGVEIMTRQPILPEADNSSFTPSSFTQDNITEYTETSLGYKPKIPLQETNKQSNDTFVNTTGSEVTLDDLDEIGLMTSETTSSGLESSTMTISTFTATNYTKELVNNETEIPSQEISKETNESLLAQTDSEGLYYDLYGETELANKTISSKEDRSDAFNYTKTLTEKETGIPTQEINEGLNETLIATEERESLPKDSHEVETLTTETVLSDFENQTIEPTSVPQDLATKFETPIIIETENVSKVSDEGVNETLFTSTVRVSFLTDSFEDNIWANVTATEENSTFPTNISSSSVTLASISPDILIYENNITTVIPELNATSVLLEKEDQPTTINLGTNATTKTTTISQISSLTVSVGPEKTMSTQKPRITDRLLDELNANLKNVQKNISDVSEELKSYESDFNTILRAEQASKQLLKQFIKMHLVVTMIKNRMTKKPSANELKALRSLNRHKRQNIMQFTSEGKLTSAKDAKCSNKKIQNIFTDMQNLKSNIIELTEDPRNVELIEDAQCLAKLIADEIEQMEVSSEEANETLKIHDEIFHEHLPLLEKKLAEEDQKRLQVNRGLRKSLKKLRQREKVVRQMILRQTRDDVRKETLLNGDQMQD